MTYKNYSLDSTKGVEAELRLIIEGDNAIVKQSVLDMIAKYVADNYLQVLTTDIKYRKNAPLANLSLPN